MGLAVTPEYEELLGKGYPHLRRLITPHPDEANAHHNAEVMLDLRDPDHYFVDWPAAVARGYLRGYAKSVMGGAPVHEAMSAAAANTGPIDAAEARTLVAAYLCHEHYQRYDFHAAHALFLLEAIVGSAAVVDLVLTEFEAMKDLEGEYSTRNAFAYDIGFVIRRLPAKDCKAAEARVQALVDKHPDSFVRDFLSYVVGGRAALEASERNLGLYCVHFCDDPQLIRDLAADSVVSWDAHHYVLAGDPLLDALTEKVRKRWTPWKPLVIEQLGRLASPKAVAALREFGKTAKFAKQVGAILTARGVKPAAPAAKKPAAKKPAATKKPAAKKKH